MRNDVRITLPICVITVGILSQFNPSTQFHMGTTRNVQRIGLRQNYGPAPKWQRFNSDSTEATSDTEVEDEDEDDDPDAIDTETLGTWTDEDLKDCYMGDTEWDPAEGDPNNLQPNLEYAPPYEYNEDGIEVGWDPIFGSSNPFDRRTIVSDIEPYVVDPKYREQDPQVFKEPDDPEIEFNEHVKDVRLGMKIVDTYVDPWLETEVPREVARWYGHPEPARPYPRKDFMNNRFTKPEDKTNFTNFSPYQARKKAVEMARSYNTDWLPEGLSDRKKAERQQIYNDKGILVGSLQEGEIIPEIVEQIQPCLKVLNTIATLLETGDGKDKTVFRFHYKGPLKHKRGMSTWAITMIEDCGVPCTNVVFETGNRDMGGKNIVKRVHYEW